MFVEVVVLYKNNTKKNIIIKGDNILEVEDRLKQKVKEYSKNLNIVSVFYKKSDCFVIKDGFSEDLDRIIKKFFSTKGV